MKIIDYMKKNRALFYLNGGVETNAFLSLLYARNFVNVKMCIPQERLLVHTKKYNDIIYKHLPNNFCLKLFILG